jgi:hypothetical protein
VRIARRCVCIEIDKQNAALANILDRVHQALPIGRIAQQIGRLIRHLLTNETGIVP